MQGLPGLPSVLIDVFSFIYCAVYRERQRTKDESAEIGKTMRSLHAQQIANVFRLDFVNELHFFLCHKLGVVVDVRQILERFLRQGDHGEGPVDYPVQAFNA